MAKKRFMHIPMLSTRLTALVSVTLVLMILGLAALVGIAAQRLTQSVKDNIGFVVIFNESVTAGDIAQVTGWLKDTGAVKGTAYSSADQILDRWQQMVGEDENIMSLAGVNPFTPELEVFLAEAYLSPDSLTRLTAPLALMPQVSEVKVHHELIDNVNSSLRTVTLILIAVGTALLCISFVLIFNTVRLSVYSQRFLINTMQLVGATRSFIRRPFLLNALAGGFAAGLLASGLLALAICGGLSIDPQVTQLMQWHTAACVMCAMAITGILICLLATAMACNRYLNMRYDDMYR